MVPFFQRLHVSSHRGALVGLLILGAAAACSGGGEQQQDDDAGRNRQSQVDGGDADSAIDGEAPGRDATVADAGSGDGSAADAVADDALSLPDAQTDAPSPVDARTDATDAVDAQADAYEGADAQTDATDGTDAPADASVDAAPDANPVAPVTMLVRLGGAPESGVLVVFQDNEGAILTYGTTDTTGKFAAVVPSGSQVTVVLNDGVNIQLETVTALEPGDALTTNDPGVTTATVDVNSVPPPPSSAQNFNVSAGGGCSSTNLTTGTAPLGTLVVGSGCSSSGQFSLLARTFDDNEQEIGYTYQDGNSMQGAGPDGGIPIALARAWSPPVVSNLTTPSVFPSFRWGAFVYEEESAGGIFYSGGQSPGPILPPDGGPFVIPVVSHIGYPDAVQVEESIYEETSSPYFVSAQASATRIAAPTESATIPIDALSNALPAVLSLSVVSNAGAPSPTEFAWTTAAPLTDTDMVAASMSWSSTAGYVTWTVFGPPTVTSFRLPALPTQVASLYPPSTQVTPNAGITPVVYAVDASFLAGYGDFKTTFSSFVPGLGLLVVTKYGEGFSSGLVPFLPVLGSARLTAYVSIDG